MQPPIVPAARVRPNLIPVLAIMLLVARVPALFQPRATDDEQVYAVVAREMLAGGRPYLDAIERKPPLLFVVYAAVLGSAGPSNWAALHVVSLLWTLATMAALFAVARQLFDRRISWLAALLYGIFQLWADYRNLSLNGELLMNLPIILAYWLAFLPTRRQWRPELFLSGMLIAIAFLLKQPAAIAGVPLGVYVLTPSYRTSRGYDWQDSFFHAVDLALGLGATLVLTSNVLTGYGILDEAIYWTLTAHRDPIGPAYLPYWIHCVEATGLFLLECVPLWVGGIISLTRSSAPLWRGKIAERNCLAMLLAVSLVGVSVNGQFLFHYYLQLLPPLTLLAAPVIAGFLSGSSNAARRLASLLVVTLGLFMLVDGIGLARNRQTSVAAEWVKAHSASGDRIFVWGQGDDKTGMYLDADRRPASRFISPFPLTGHVFGGYPPEWGLAYEDRHVLRGAWDTLAVDFARHAPKFVIDAESKVRDTHYPIHRYPLLERLLAKDYRPVADLADGVVYQLVR